ncbi:MAG: hypothetical protein JW896_18445 [Deltaproteobacteria bacterium]|nr:hypothetical protein [Deltaproteobacteria bacterium]
MAFRTQNANVYLYRGFIYCSEGKFRRARFEFDKVMALNPKAAIAEGAEKYLNRARFGSYSAFNYTDRSGVNGSLNI